MTVATQTRSWQREPVGDPAPPDGPPAAPSLFPLLDWLVGVHGGKSLSTSSLWHDRPVRGGSVPSSHRGAAFDWRYESPGPGRQYMLDTVLPTLIGDSFELDVQQVHDYVGCRVWKASRSGDSAGGWARQNPGSHSGMMGAAWAQWLHVEAGEWAWADGRPVPDKLGSQPVPQPPESGEEEDEMDGYVTRYGPDNSIWVVSPLLNTRHRVSEDVHNQLKANGKYAVISFADPNELLNIPATSD